MNSHYEDGSVKNDFVISNVRSAHFVQATFLFLHTLSYVLYSFAPSFYPERKFFFVCLFAELSGYLVDRV